MFASLGFHLIKEHLTVLVLDLVLDRSGKNPISCGLLIKKQVFPNLIFKVYFLLQFRTGNFILILDTVTHKLAILTIHLFSLPVCECLVFQQGD